MNQTTQVAWKRFLPIGLIAIAAVTISGIALTAEGLSGWKKTALCLAAATAAAGGIAGVVTSANARPSQNRSPDERSLDEQTAEFEQLASATRNEFSDREHDLNQRERNLADRWVKHQEWFEYPDPLTNADGKTFDSRLNQQDQQVLNILEEESKLVYEKILSNAYVIDGQADTSKIRDEVLDLVNRIARIYSPEHENPLLETSIEQLIRASSRACLHLLVVLEQLPLDVKSYNINSAYGYIQKAVRSYGAYKSAEPWLTYLGRTAYVGRFVAGANPVTLGAWWAATEIGKRGASKVMKNVIDRQAIGFLHDFIRVIGFEVASIYSGDFRHRDPNWIYGTELTELLHHFPVSRENLSEALQQVAGLQLRNEYDRIYLYRCLASRKVAGPQLADPTMLEREDREKIVQRIEDFFRNHVHGQTEQKVAAWREQFETRLDTRIKLLEQPETGAQSAEIHSALKSVATFMNTICQASPETVDTAIRQTRLFKMLPESERSGFVPHCDSTFEAPDVEPHSTVADNYLKDLATTTVVLDPSVPHSPATSSSGTASDQTSDSDSFAEPLFIQSGHYFRVPPTEMQSLLDAEYVNALQESLPVDAPAPRISTITTRMIVKRRFESDHRLLFVYPDATVNGTTGTLIALRDLANETHLIVINEASPNTPLWTASGKITAKRVNRMIKDDCELASDSTSGTVTVEGSFRGGRFQTYFEPLLQECHFDSSTD